MSLPKNYHSMKPSDKIAAQQSVYREQQKMYTMGSEKPTFFHRASKFLWKEPVQKKSDLPLRPSSLEARFVLEEDRAYFWLNGSWQLMVVQQGLEVKPKKAAEAEEPIRKEALSDLLDTMMNQKLQADKILMDKQSFDEILNWLGEPESEPDMELLIGGPVKIPDWALPPSVREEQHAIPFFTISRENFEKTEQELLAYQMPITRIIEENSVKDIQAIEDEDWLSHVLKAAHYGVLELIPGEWAVPPREFDNIFEKEPKSPFDDLFSKVE